MMNSIAGAAVYGVGEVAVQYSHESKNINIKRVAGISALGSVGMFNVHTLNLIYKVTNLFYFIYLFVSII